MNEESRQIGGYTVELSNLDKGMFPEDGLTKRDLIAYYERIAERMLPYMKDRPLNMQRFPDGIGNEGFYEKKVPDYFPDWISVATVPVKESGENQQQVVCDRAATLVYLANQACITPHIWLSRSDELNQPDRLVFDLDPPEGSRDFAPVVKAAQRLREMLREYYLVPFVMTTGSRGLHVLVPLDGRADFDSVRAFARSLADKLAGQYPDDFTTEVRKDKREGRLFLDYLRNAYGQTAVTPYALRPLPGAPVATPLDWSELDEANLDSQSYHFGNIFRRLGQKVDPWQELEKHKAGIQMS